MHVGIREASALGLMTQREPTLPEKRGIPFTGIANAPPADGAPDAQRDGVSDGNRTRDLQNHNLAL